MQVIIATKLIKVSNSAIFICIVLSAYMYSLIFPVSCSMDSSIPTGKVILLQDSLPVGKGAVVEGELSHGHAIPAGSVRVVVEEIEDGICPPCSSAFDDEFIVSGQFGVWPIQELQY